MNLFPKHIRDQLPKLYATEHNTDGAIVAVVKFFTPDSYWTWYACEFDGDDLFFGFVVGHEAEWGYYSLQALKTARGPRGLPIERDLGWRPKPMREAEPARFGLRWVPQDGGE